MGEKAPKPRLDKGETAIQCTISARWNLTENSFLLSPFPRLYENNLCCSRRHRRFFAQPLMSNSRQRTKNGEPTDFCSKNYFCQNVLFLSSWCISVKPRCVGLFVHCYVLVLVVLWSGPCPELPFNTCNIQQETVHLMGHSHFQHQFAVRLGECCVENVDFHAMLRLDSCAKETARSAFPSFCWLINSLSTLVSQESRGPQLTLSLLLLNSRHIYIKRSFSQLSPFSVPGSICLCRRQ